MLLNYGFKNVAVCDSKGLIHKGRTDIHSAKLEIANLTKQEVQGEGTLKNMLKNADVFIGVSGPGIITRTEVQTMKSKPIIFWFGQSGTRNYASRSQSWRCVHCCYRSF
jgi:malate dehydrogenase (oxaloacetate-decarboxylating)